MLKVVLVSNWPFIRIQALKRIAESQHNMSALIILPDTSKKRTKRVVTRILAGIPGGPRISGQLSGRITPEKVELYRTAKLADVRIYEVTDINASKLISRLHKLRPDVVLTLAWPKKFGRELLQLPTLGCINCHPSLLPFHRGPNPIPRAILAGDTKSGVTFHFMNEEFDLGDILMQKQVPIHATDNSRTLQDKCAAVAKDSLTELLDGLDTGKLHGVPQERNAGSYAANFKKSDLNIDWEKTSAEIDCKMRALLPGHQSYTYHKAQKIVITRVEKRQVEPTFRPGQIVSISAEGLLIASKDAGLLLQEFVFAELSEQSSRQYSDNQMKTGDILGSIA